MMETNFLKYKHHLFWLFWPILCLRYILIERVFVAGEYHVIEHSIDSLIPFSELFILPYWFWSGFMVLLYIYLFYTNTEEFKKYSKLLILLFSVSTLTFILYPSCQNLRPETYPRDNILTDAVIWLHSIDTNTNVLPSEHVIGSLAVIMASWRNGVLKQPRYFSVIVVIGILISISTLFLKQHSIIDMVVAIPVCLVGYWIIYGRKENVV